MEPQGFDAAAQTYGEDFAEPEEVAEEETYEAEPEEVEAEEVAEEEVPATQYEAPDYWGPSGVATAPTISEEDETQFVSRAEMMRYAAQVASQAAQQAIQGYEASSAVTGYHLRTIEDKAPEFYRHYAPGMKQAIASVSDPQLKAKKETTTAAVLTAVLKDANKRGVDAVDAILEAATLIQRSRATPPKATPKVANVRAAVPSQGGGRGTATVASNVRQKPSGVNLMESLYGMSAQETRAIQSAPEIYGNRK